MTRLASSAGFSKAGRRSLGLTASFSGSAGSPPTTRTPKPDALTVHCDQSATDASVDVLETNTLNCVRAVATRAIGAVLFEHPDRLAVLEGAIRQAVGDPHPVVRMAALEPLLAMLSMGGEAADRATREFIGVARSDLRIAAYHRAHYFFSEHLARHFSLLGPLLLDMTRSTHSEVAQSAAEGVAAYWLFDGFFAEELPELTRGTQSQRLGVCQAAVRYFADPQTAGRARGLLLRFLDDDHEEVRKQVSSVFGGQYAAAALADSDFCAAYIKSAAFRPDEFHLVRSIGDQSDLRACAALVIAVCLRFVTAFSDAGRHGVSSADYTASCLVTVLRRLYEQAREADDEITVQQCLDQIDAFAQCQIGYRDVLDDLAL